MSGRIETKNSTRQRVAHKFGFDKESVLDIVKRKDYASDDAYLDACVQEQLRRSTPEYREARAALEAQYRERQEKEQREKCDAAAARFRSAVKLDAADEKEISAEAARRAKGDLALGKISYDNLAGAIENYGKQLTDDRINQKVENSVMNALIRGEL